MAILQGDGRFLFASRRSARSWVLESIVPGVWILVAAGLLYWL